MSLENVSSAEENEENETVVETATEATEAIAPVSLRESVSSLLFLAPRPLNSLQLAEYCDVSPESIDEILPLIQSEVASLEIGFELIEVGGAWQFRTRPSCSKVVTKLIPPRARKLSKAAAETLAVVAYKQPVPRSEIEAIRGVDALPTLKTLLDARLIRVIGRDDSVGQPALYGTTQTFLEKYGLRDLAELPTVREIVELTSEPGESAPDAPAAEEREDDVQESLSEQILVEGASNEEADSSLGNGSLGNGSLGIGQEIDPQSEDSQNV